MPDLHEEATTCSPGETRPRAVLIVLMVGTFMAPLDASIVNIGLPAIASQFGVGLSAVGWVTSVYLLTSASLLLSMGRLGDVWGLRSLYAWGLVVFGVGSLACALAPSLPLLLAARAGQAIGAAMLFAAGPALVTRTFPPNRRGWALGYIALAVSAGLTVGPALGGLLVGTFGWPSIFLINVPLTLVVAVLAWRLLPEECPEGERFDVLGGVLGGGALLLLLLGLGAVESQGVVSIPVIAPVVASVAAGFAFVGWERRAPHPMVDLRLFADREFSVGVAAATMAYLSLFAVTFNMPFYLLRVEGFDARVAGLVLTTTPIAMAALAPVAGRISDRSGSRTLTVVGLSVLALGLLVLSYAGPAAPPLHPVFGLLVVGSGMALFQTPNTAAVLRATPRSSAGVGSAFVAEARNVGMAIGVATTAAIVGLAVGPGGLPQGSGPVPAEVALAFTSGMSTSLRTAAVISAFAALLSWFGHAPAAVEPQHGKP